MRIPSAYEYYIQDMYDYYKTRKEEFPQWLRNASWCRYIKFYYLGYSLRGLAIQTIEKIWNYFSSVHVDYSDPNSLPPELSDFYKQTYDVLFELNRLFVTEKDPLYVNGKQITKAGGKKMNELSDQLPHFFHIQMPENKFTNMPSAISFNDRYVRSYRDKANYGLEIKVFKYIVIEHEGINSPLNFKILSMTPELMDELIRILQWERIRPFLKEENSENADDSKYSDFKIVHVHAERYHADINLLEETDDNPFIKILHMIWDEYGIVMKDENIVPPWFDILGLK